jgi:hypothetical protein
MRLSALNSLFSEEVDQVRDLSKSAVMDARSSEGRDSRIDTLRGLFLVVMTFDHLPNHPLLRFTAQSFGFVSAAEGFVFVSGIVSAWVYGRILAEQGEANLRRRAWHRARDLYLTYLLLYTLALVGGLWGGRQIASQFPDFWTGWWHGALLIYRPPFSGILPMYAVFLLLTPLLLEQMTRGRTLLIGSASVALWLAAQWGVGSPAHNPSWLQLGGFNILAWQLLFVAGVYFGYRKAAGRGSPLRASRLLLVFSVVLVALLFLVRHKVLFVGNLKLVDVPTVLGAWKSINHPLRLINFAAFAYILWYLPRSIDKKLHGLSAFRFLRYLGRHSLQVFAWSILVAYTASSFRVSWAALSPAWRTLLAVAAALSLAIPAWLHQRWTLRRANSFSLTTANTNAPVGTPFAAVGANDLSLPADGEA